MHKRFRGKTIIITEAVSAVSRELAIRFAQEGANLVLVDNDKQALLEMLEQLPEDTSWLHENHYLTITCDINNHEQVTKMLSAVSGEFDHIDVLVNPVANISDDLAQAIVPFLKASHGNMVYLSSELEQSELSNKVIEKMAVKYRDEGVRVNEVLFPRQVTEKINNQSQVKQSQVLLREVLLDDVVDSVTFLASEEASMITGVSLPIDGGLRLTL